MTAETQTFPEDIMATAAELANATIGNYERNVRANVSRDAIAKAILAERERCAKIADAVFTGRERQQAEAMRRGDKKAARDFQSMKFEAIEIAAAIRGEA